MGVIIKTFKDLQGSQRKGAVLGVYLSHICQQFTAVWVNTHSGVTREPESCFDIGSVHTAKKTEGIDV